MASTRKELVERLQEVLNTNTSATPEAKAKLEEVISLAKQGAYHDFDTTYATPKINLVSDLSELVKLGVPVTQIALDVQNGLYDEGLRE